jgi:hypothetical protein
MNETMREYLRRRQRWNVALFVIGLILVLLPVSLAAVFGREQMREHRDTYVLIRLVGVAFLIGGSLLGSRTKCPKCQKPLRTGGRWSSVPAFCPNCGVNLDEPMPQRQNPIS